MFIALMAITTVQAQQISVVAENGTTTLYRTLQDAIEGAPGGSVIYLPSGGFQISDDVKISKKLTIIGIGHKAVSENADGNTTIAGNLWFNEGSSGSAVMGCYISGNVNIAENGPVNGMLVCFCNLNSIQITNSECTGTVIKQNYIRAGSNFGNSEVTINNNVIGKIQNVGTGVISYNTVCHSCSGAARYSQYYRTLENVNNSTIIGNIFRIGESPSLYFCSVSSCNISGNLCVGWSIGDVPVTIDAGADNIFVNANGWSISPFSDFHFKKEYKEYETQVGIYAGPEPFDDKQMAPVPYIIEKKVDSQTDASGQLNIKIRVKASE